MGGQAMIQAIISICQQVSPDGFETYYHTKTFDKTATIQEIEDWAKTYGVGYRIFDVKFATLNQTEDKP
jgi:hypothetical protein